MICCALGVAAVATGAIGWKRFRRFLRSSLRAQSLVAAGAAAAVAITITALSVEHFLHHAAHASGPEMAFGDSLPLCSGSDRTTTIASNED
jgi:uncharacterized membrane protein YhiD involved in acid resistance